MVFKEVIFIGLIIVMKFDGSVKGGGVFLVVVVMGVLIKFIGIGERIDDFEFFDLKCFVLRLFGFGDI